MKISRVVLGCVVLVMVSVLPTSAQQVEYGPSINNPYAAHSLWDHPDGLPKPLHDVPAYDVPFDIQPVPYTPPPTMFKGTGRICVMVEARILEAVNTELTNYIDDLTAEGYTVFADMVTGGTPEDIRSTLSGYYQEAESLAGAVFIGDLPYMVFELVRDEPGIPPYEDFPCDVFYMDLDGIWEDVGDGGPVPAGNGKYDSHSGNTALEIWVSRINVSDLPTLGNEADVLNAYLRRDRAFRYGWTSVSGDALIYFDDDFGDFVAAQESAVAELYGADGIVSVHDPETTTKTDYLDRLTEGYQYLSLSSHGNQWDHSMYYNDRADKERVRTTDYRATDPQTPFYYLFTCSACDHTVNDYLGGTIVFNPESKGLFAIGFAAIGYITHGGKYDRFYSELADGANFGEAFVYWYNSVRTSTFIKEYGYGLVMLGDASLWPITDGVLAPPVSFDSFASSGDETITQLDLAVSLDEALGQTVSVDYQVVAGTATRGDDYLLDDGTLTFTPGQTTQNISIAITGDETVEEDETILIVLANPVGVALGAVSEHTYTILDNEIAPNAFFDNDSSSGNVRVSPVNIEVNLSETSDKTVTADYSVTGGSALDGEDYVLDDGTLTFEPGETTLNISMEIIDNHAAKDYDDTVVVTLSDLTNARMGGISEHTFTIIRSTVLVPDDYPTIGKAIDEARTGEFIMVSPGTYTERVSFGNRSIILTSTDPTNPSIVESTIIDGDQSGSTVRFSGSENESCLLTGFTITGGNTGGAYSGGGISGGGTMATIEYNVITGNVTGGDYVSGGGIYDCDGLIQHNQVWGNFAGLGGGMSHCDGTIHRNNISENGAQSGGGLYLCNGTIQSNLVSLNEGFINGGGLCACQGTIQNNVISMNNAGSQGGGLYGCDDGIVWNNTIWNNSAETGGGIYSCSTPVVNCIIWGNTAGTDPQLSASTAPYYCCIEGLTDGENGNISTHPLLVEPGIYDFRLRPESPCIDAGSAGVGPAYDFDGQVRGYDGSDEIRGDGSDIDIGADEYMLADDDGDGLPDDWEIGYFGNSDHGPNDNDDGDGLTNGEEYLNRTDPTNADSDGDGLDDDDEVNIHGTSPISGDTDDDGMSDVYEILHDLDPTVDDSESDPDGDGLTNAVECQLGCNPHSSDTDDDGLTDSEEVETYETDPTESDTDGDKLSDGDEINFDGEPGYNPYDSELNPTGTDLDPTKADTDGDGAFDGAEVSAESNPLDPDSVPLCSAGDVNCDDSTNAIDVQLTINAALGLDVDGDCDINRSDSVDAVDVQLAINAALGIDISGAI